MLITKLRIRIVTKRIEDSKQAIAEYRDELQWLSALNILPKELIGRKIYLLAKVKTYQAALEEHKNEVKEERLKILYTHEL